MQSENMCVNFHGYEDIRKDIVKAGNVLVFRLNVCQLVNGKSFLRKTTVTAVPSSTFVINGHKYQLMAAVCEVATSTRPGINYKAIILSNCKWLHCSDLSTSTESWPWYLFIILSNTVCYASNARGCQTN